MDLSEFNERYATFVHDLICNLYFVYLLSALILINYDQYSRTNKPVCEASNDEGKQYRKQINDRRYAAIYKRTKIYELFRINMTPEYSKERT